DREFSLVSYDLYKFLRDNTKGFAESAAFPAPEPLFGVRRTGSSEAAQSYPGEFVSGNYFTMFGIRPYAGRMLTDTDDQASTPPVAVISYRLWQEKYGSDPSVVGSVFNLNDKPFTVVGITPPDFFSDSDDGFRICAADRVRERGQPHDGSRHGASAASIAKHGPGRASCASHKAASHRKHLALVIWRHGRSADRICRYTSDSAFCIPL